MTVFSSIKVVLTHEFVRYTPSGESLPTIVAHLRRTGMPVSCEPHSTLIKVEHGHLAIEATGDRSVYTWTSEQPT